MKSTIKIMGLVLTLLVSQLGFSQSDSTQIQSTTSAASTSTTSSKNRGTEYQSLFGGSQKAFGGYFGLNSHYTVINDQDALLLGAELTAVINHSFNIGFQGYGLVTSNETGRTTDFGDQLYLALGYGGLKLEPVAYYNSVVHLSFPILMGAGGITEYSKNYYYGYYQPYYYEHNYDYFFVLEPGIELEVNVLKFMRVTTGASYRLTSDINIIGMQDNNLNGFNFDLSLKFGWF